MTEPAKLANPNHEEHRREIATKLNLALQGRLNTNSTVTLASGTTSTVVNDPRIWAQTVPLLVPLNALAAAMLPYVYVSSRAAGTLTLTHPDPALGVSNQVDGIVIVCSDETTALTAGTNKVTFRMPYAFVALDAKASLTTAQTSGSLLTVDVNEAGTSILSTKLTFDNGEETTVTAATPRVISDTTLAADAEITVDIDTVGDGTAKGLKVELIGYPSGVIGAPVAGGDADFAVVFLG